MKKLRFKTLPQDLEGERLDAVLFELAGAHKDLVEVSKRKVRKWIDDGAVYVNSKRVRVCSRKLVAGAKIELVIANEIKQAQSKQKAKAEITDKDVAFEDEYLIVINKPTGLPTQATLDQARDHLFAATERYLKARDGKSRVYLGLHHRLDRDTSGLVLMTKKKMVNKAVSDLFKDRMIKKKYLALVANKNEIESSFEVKNHLGKKGKRQWRMQAVLSGGDYAHTKFRKIAESGDFALLEAMPLTGRTHQIRVHLAELDLPIIGDTLYGDDTAKTFERLYLHAFQLAFDHPIAKEKIRVEAKAPKAFSDLVPK
jgi:23S rRNA pseudouridine1911/1915/1917 synthase